MNRVAVIIPMYNFPELTDKCIELTNKNAGIPVDILVIDDGSEKVYCNETDNVVIHRLETNSGFTHAINQGILALDYAYDYVVLLNNDTEPEPDFILNMVKTADAEPAIGIVGAGRITQRGGTEMHGWGSDLTTGMVYVATTADTEPSQCIWIPFCCVLLTKRCIQTVGLLDERMVNHCSDNDYGLRAVMLDFAVVFEPRARVFHYQSPTINSKQLTPYDDQKVLIRKWFGPALNEILNLIPVNYELNKYGKLTFQYEIRKKEEPLIVT